MIEFPDFLKNDLAVKQVLTAFYQYTYQKYQATIKLKINKVRTFTLHPNFIKGHVFMRAHTLVKQFQMLIFDEKKDKDIRKEFDL